ncbi:MAG TPA: PilZ domain-containing protein [Bryobacteraceae bacterium]|nr:PilZ domain-containing protein [Bryobacteraceae bacterium]
MERRGAKRFPVYLPMSILAAEKQAVPIPAFSCNISGSGVLLRCSAELVVGQRITYQIELNPGRMYQLLCSGTVVRMGIPESDPDEMERANYLYGVTVETYQCIRVSVEV